MRKTEDIMIFGIKSPLYFPQGLKIGKQNKNSGIENTYGKVKKDWKQKVTYTNYPVDVLEYNNIIGSKASHPTQKPVPLLEYLIKTYTLENETVLDFTAGSFSTGVAAVNLNRSFIGIELDKDYFEIGKKRVNDALEAREK